MNVLPPNSSSFNIDARGGIWNFVGGDQYNTTVHGDQINHIITPDLDILRRASSAAAIYSSGEREPAPKCLPGTREDVLTILSDWARNDDHRQVCWLKGPAGYGKSAIAQSMAETCAAAGTLAASFFFSRRHAERSNSKRFFPTIALQLTKSIPQAKRAIYQAINRDPLLPDEILRDQFQQLIIEPLMEVDESYTSPLIVIIDALDECDDDALVGEIVSLFTRTLHHGRLRLRVLITSRPQMHIESKMADLAISPTVFVCELQGFINDADIRLFLKDSLAEIYRKRQRFMDDVELPWPSHDAVDVLVRRASGLFIYASTVVNFLDRKHGRPDQQLKRILNVGAPPDVKMYSGLDSLYLDVVISASDAHPDGNPILGIIALLFDPLPIRDLARLLAKPTGEVRLHLQELHSVLLVPDTLDESIRMYHASFRDFLIDPQRSSSHSIDQRRHHSSITLFSLRLMTEELRRDPCSICDPSKLNSEVPDLHAMCKTSIGGAVQYACRYWGVHLSKSTPDRTLLAALQGFVSKSLLYWIETLSLLGRFDESTIPSLQMASTWLKGLPIPPSELIELFYDAERFVLEFFDVISASASHVYYSALPFAPSSTRLRKMYAHELSGTIRVVYGIQDSWSACLRVISTASPVRSVAFSPDNTYVASATEKEGVQLWKTLNGINFATLGGDNLSCSVTFSSDGLRVAVGEADGFVHMWEVETGSSLITEQAHQRPVNDVSFAPDNTVLASASSDMTINLWDARTGRILGCLSGHTGDVTCIAFSPDSQRLASASNDTTIRVWDKTFRCLVTLTGHTNAVLSITFSPNGTHIASGSADKTVRLWHPSTGKCTTTKAFHSKGVVAVKYSSDGLSVISISEDLTVKCFHVTKGKSITIWSFAQFFRRYMSNIPGWHRKVFTLVPPGVMGIKPTIDAMAFSTISVTPFALAAEDSIIVLHDLGPSCDAPFLGGDSPSSALAFSRNGAYLASGSPVRDILICDTSLRDRTWEKMAFMSPEIMAVAPDGTRFVTSTTGDISLINVDGSLIAELRPSSLTTTWSVIFSPDSRLIAVTSGWTSTIRLFDSQSGASIPGPVSRLGLFFDAKLTCVVFSPDSTLLACGDSTCTPEVRCVASGQRVARLQQTFEGEVTCVAFSPNMSCIVFGDSAGIVRCWNWREDVIHISPNLHDAGVTSAVCTPDGTRVVSGSSNGSLQVWILGADSINWRSSNSIAILSLSFHSSATGVELVCRDEKRAMEIWNFGEDEKNNQMIPRLSWRTTDGCVVADQALESKFFLRDDGWFFDGTSKVCWIPKMYRPLNNIFYMRGNRLTAVVGDYLLILDFSACLTNQPER